MKEIRVVGKKGSLLVRDSFVVAFFCRKPLQDVAKPFADSFGLWLDSAPLEGKRWCAVGPDAGTYSPLTAQRLGRARRQFQIARMRSDEVRSLRMGGPQQINPDYWFSAEGHQELEGNEACVIEIRFPTSVIEAPGVQWALGFVRRVADLVPYDSGYASLGATFGVDSQIIEFAPEVRGLAFRYPGLDIADNAATAFEIGCKLRGARWLTFIGQEALADLGGSQKLRKKLDRKISMVPVGPGWMIQAGEKPELGDVNRGQNLPLLRSLAKVLEPVTLFNDQGIADLFRVEEEDLERWERRFFAPEYGDEDDDSSKKDDDD